MLQMLYRSGIKYRSSTEKVYVDTRTAVSAASSNPSKARIFRPDSLIILCRRSTTRDFWLGGGENILLSLSFLGPLEPYDEGDIHL